VPVGEQRPDSRKRKRETPGEPDRIPPLQQHAGLDPGDGADDRDAVGPTLDAAEDEWVLADNGSDLHPPDLRRLPTRRIDRPAPIGRDSKPIPVAFPTMGVRPSRRRHAAAAVMLTALIVIAWRIGGAEAIGAPPITRPRCNRPSSTTLLETAKVRLYAMPRESTAHPEHRDPEITGRPVFGCLRATGRSHLLDLPEIGGERRAYWVEVGPKTVAANGPLIAYAYTQYYFDTHETWIRVRNLNTGAITRSCWVGGGLAPGRRPHVTDIVLHSNGEVGWHTEGEEAGASEPRPSGCDLA
jgi:hypothetical protein